MAEAAAGALERDADAAALQATEPDAAAATVAGGAVDVDADDDAGLCANLFRGLVFYLGREVPREALLLVIRSFGGAVGWQGEGSPLLESDESITHQVDPPLLHAVGPLGDCTWPCKHNDCCSVVPVIVSSLRPLSKGWQCIDQAWLVTSEWDISSVKKDRPSGTARVGAEWVGVLGKM